MVHGMVHGMVPGACVPGLVRLDLGVGSCLVFDGEEILTPFWIVNN